MSTASVRRRARALQPCPGMLRRIAFTLALGLGSLACAFPHDSDDESSRPGNEPGLRLSVCGTVKLFAPPSPDARGVLVVDEAAWYLVVGARLTGAELLVVGRDVCLNATLDPARRMLACAVTPAPETDRWAAWPEAPPE